MSLAFKSAEFWSQESLEAEFRRVFDVCHGCRRCFNLCPSFDTLFKRIDQHDGDVHRLSSQDFQVVQDLCYQCKLCYNHCPYTPPHRFNVDFPHLMLRAKLVYIRRRGVAFRDRLLGNIDLVGRMGSATAPLANWGNRNPIVRFPMEVAVGIHHKKSLPTFHGETFAQWFKKHKKSSQKPSGANGKAALFYTCSVNYNDQEVGKATVQVLERNGIGVAAPEQRCCGMPYLDGGALGSALKNMEFNIKRLKAVVDEGYEIVVPGPTCSYVLKREYPYFVDTDDARTVAQHTFDICEYLMKLKARGKLDTNFVKSPGKIAYQFPCHLKSQNVGYKSRDLMKLIPGADVEVIERCSGHDGTWAMKKEYFELSLEVGRRLFEDVKEQNPDVVASDCPLAALQIEQGTGRKVVHPILVLKQAYGL
ncbi:MAG: anaerobic glycerol-3-phosphate dehydrogenase subunit C [Chloroflexi bacterium]|nr:anaerobic glycerol-3-phosphate dehydrogenase subunit C [Chloroflexota bacterium]